MALLLVTDAESVATSDYDVLNKYFAKVPIEVVQSLIFKREGDAPEAFPLLGENNQLAGSEGEQYTIVYRLIGSLTYVNVISHLHHLQKLLGGDTRYIAIIMDIRRVNYIDFDGAVGLREIEQIFQSKGIEVLFTYANDYVNNELSKHEFFFERKYHSKVFQVPDDAIEYIQRNTAKNNPYAVDI